MRFDGDTDHFSSNVPLAINFDLARQILSLYYSCLLYSRSVYFIHDQFNLYRTRFNLRVLQNFSTVRYKHEIKAALITNFSF